MMRSVEAPIREGAPGSKVASAYLRARVALPVVRVLWIFLAILGAYGVYFLGGTIGVAPLLFLPLIAVLVDLVFSRIRFETLRFPDSAIVTGLFVGLILPPTVSLLAAGTVTVAAIAVKHSLRYRGRPWFNPAVIAVVLAVLLFGASPAWWGSIQVTLVVALGAALILWNYRDWRLPASFLLAYAGLAILQRAIVATASGVSLPPDVFILAALDPAILFFALFMVVEPRTAPSNRRLHPIYAVLVAAGSALLPVVLPTLSVFVALIAGNLFAVAVRFISHRASSANPAEMRGDAARSKKSRRPSRGASSSRWSVTRRIAAGVGILLIVGIAAAASYHPTGGGPPILPPSPGGGSGGGGGGGATAAACQKDNASIPSSTLSQLHKMLGPSTILQYNPQTGAVLFYDPVNSVTVYETDLYEDFGYAEFNGDDQTLSGCVA